MSNPLHGANWPPGDHDLPEAQPDLSVATFLGLLLFSAFVVVFFAMLTSPEDCPVQTALLDPKACDVYERTPAYWAERGY
jgi:hypothetical protein